MVVAGLPATTTRGMRPWPQRRNREGAGPDMSERRTGEPHRGRRGRRPWSVPATLRLAAELTLSVMGISQMSNAVQAIASRLSTGRPGPATVTQLPGRWWKPVREATEGCRPPSRGARPGLRDDYHQRAAVAVKWLSRAEAEAAQGGSDTLEGEVIGGRVRPPFAAGGSTPKDDGPQNDRPPVSAGTTRPEHLVTTQVSAVRHRDLCRSMTRPPQRRGNP